MSADDLIATLPEADRAEAAQLVAEITGYLCRRWGLAAGTSLGWQIIPRFRGGVSVVAFHPDAVGGDEFDGSAGVYDRRGTIAALRLWVGLVRDEGGAP